MSKKEVSIEESIWKSANKLRGSVEPSEYKHVVLSLIFLKYISDRFEQQKQNLIDDEKEKYIENPIFYTKDNVFYLPEESRWSYIIENAKQDDIALKIDTALSTIEKNNDTLKGALPDNYFSRLDLDRNKLASLLDVINNISTSKDKEQDLLGKIYEYCLSQFAIKEGKGKGEFYTPKSIVNLIAEIIEPYDGIIYDPCCGSGGMFVQSYKFIENHRGNTKNVSVYGQESITTTMKLAKMNLAIRGINSHLGKKAADTFFDDQHKDLRADYIMANPPFNQADWRAENELINDPRWSGYEVPPKGNANYAWILHMVSKLSNNGMAGFLLANGSLSSSGAEHDIRKKLLEQGLVEIIAVLPRKLFYSTDISVSLWILNKNQNDYNFETDNGIINYRNRKNEVLFLDLRQLGVPFNKKFVELSYDVRKKIVNTVNMWRTDINKYEDILEYCYSANIEEIREKDYNLVPSQYIGFDDKDEKIDFKLEMNTLKDELQILFDEEEKSKKDIQEIFEGLNL